MLLRAYGDAARALPSLMIPTLVVYVPATAVILPAPAPLARGPIPEVNANLAVIGTTVSTPPLV